MGTSFQGQIVNYLSILSLESSMDAQLIYTHPQSICFAKIQCGCFLKPEYVSKKMVLNVGHFSVMFIITKNKVSKCQTITIGI